MDGIGPGHLGDADNLGDGQIGADGRQAFADQIGLIGLEAVQRKLVFFGIDRDGFLAHLIGRPHDANGNFAAIGDEDFLEFGHG